MAGFQQSPAITWIKDGGLPGDSMAALNKQSRWEEVL
jgi:hypothetical protein